MPLPSLRPIIITSTALAALAVGAAALGADTSEEIRLLKEQLQAVSQRLAELERRQASDRVVSVPSSEPSDPSLTELDQKIRILQREREIETEAAAEKARSTPVVTAGPTGFSIRSADTNFVLRIRGGVQADARFYDGDAGANDTFLIRRARPIFEGTVFKNFDYRVMLDLSTATSTSASNNGFLLDAYADAKISDGLRLRAGKFKEPVGLERLQSWNNLLFLERGYPTQLVPNRDVGFMAHGEIWDRALGWQVGVFNGTTDGGSSDFDASDSDKDIAARVFAQPFVNSDNNWLRGIGLGVSGTVGEREGAPRTYLSPGAQRFFGYRTGSGDNPNVVADGEAWRVSPQGWYYVGPFGLFGEYVLSAQNLRQAGGGATSGASDELVNTAWQVGASYFLTGEQNGFAAVTPLNPMTLAGGGWGAWELTARVGQLSVDDDSFPVYSDPSQSAHDAWSWALGVNWHLNRNVKIQLNYERTEFDGGEQNPATAGPESVFLGRVQITY